MKRKSLLEKEIAEASQKYYTDGSSDLSDEEFDAKLEELKSIDPTNPLVTDVGHGYSIDLDSTYGRKVKHRYSNIGSLDKVHNWKELDKDLASNPFVASLKLDGISCVLYFTNGVLDCALTRGDGETGIDVTSKIQIINPLNSVVEYGGIKLTGAVRGELLMKRSSFEFYKQSNPDAKNPRNVSAGLINQKSPSIKDLKLVSFVAYSVVACNFGIRSQIDAFELLDMYFETAPRRLYMGTSEDVFMDNMNWVKDQLESESNFEYPVDGIVLASNKLTFSGSDAFALSWNSQAFKFPAERKQTEVTDVVWNFTKTGYMVPRIKFKPIQLSGTTVEYATAFNAKYVLDNNLVPGSLVTITKSGEIIPYIVSIDKLPCRIARHPEKCPECGSPLKWEGVHLMCKNPECSGKSVIDAVWWMKEIAPIDGLSDLLIEKFLCWIECYSVEDLYSVSMDSVLEAFPNPGKQEQLFLESFKQCRTKETDICQAVKACNIPRFGSKTCEKCSGMMDQLVKFAKGIESPSDALDLQKLGSANYDSLIRNRRKLSRILLLPNLTDCKIDEEFKCKGDVCITGKLSVKRKDFEAELKAFGYNPVSSVKKDTKFLITDDPNSGSSKNKSADKYGVEKITEREFRSKWMV